MSLYVCAQCERIENTAGANLFTQQRRRTAGEQPTFPMCKPCLGIEDWRLDEYLTVAEYEAKYGEPPIIWTPPFRASR